MMEEFACCGEPRICDGLISAMDFKQGVYRFEWVRRLVLWVAVPLRPYPAMWEGLAPCGIPGARRSISWWTSLPFVHRRWKCSHLVEVVKSVVIKLRRMEICMKLKPNIRSLPRDQSFRGSFGHMHGHLACTLSSKFELLQHYLITSKWSLLMPRSKI